MQHKSSSHPLDKLINDDRLLLMEAIIPFVDSSLRKPLVLYIKTTELKLIMNSLDNSDYTHRCGFDKDPGNREEVLSSLSDCGFSDVANQMKSMKQAMDIMNMMKSMDPKDSPSDIKEPYKNIFNEYDTMNNTSPENSSMSNIMELLREYDSEN